MEGANIPLTIRWWRRWWKWTDRFAEWRTYLERTRSWLPGTSWAPWDRAACFQTPRPGRGFRRLSCPSSAGRRPAGRRWSSRCIRDRSRRIARSSVVRTTPFSWWSLRPRSTRHGTPPCRSSRRRTHLRQTRARRSDFTQIGDHVGASNVNIHLLIYRNTMCVDSNMRGYILCVDHKAKALKARTSVTPTPWAIKTEPT